MKKSRLTPFEKSRLAHQVANFYSTTIEGLRSASLYPNLIIARCALATELNDHGFTIQEIATYLVKSMAAVRAMIEKYEERRVVAGLEAFPGWDPDLDPSGPVPATDVQSDQMAHVGTTTATVAPVETAGPEASGDVDPDINQRIKQDSLAENGGETVCDDPNPGYVLPEGPVWGQGMPIPPVTLAEKFEHGTTYIPNIASNVAGLSENHIVKASDKITINLPRPSSNRVQREDFMEDMTAAFWALDGIPHLEVGKVRRLIWKHLGLPEAPS